MEIYSKNGYPSASLSNFAPHQFVFDGVQCNSMEGLLQSFKFNSKNIQIEVCKLVGLEALHYGASRNTAWKFKHTLWWNEKPYPRCSQEYSELLDSAYLALAQNEEFKQALIDTGEVLLTHSMGRAKKNDTILTESEFCGRLMAIRKILLNGGDISKYTSLVASKRLIEFD